MFLPLGKHLFYISHYFPNNQNQVSILTTHTSLPPIRRGFAPGFVNYKKGCTRLAAASDKVYQLLSHGQWFFPGTLATSTTKTSRHDIAEILLKVVLKHQKSNQNQPFLILALVGYTFYCKTTFFPVNMTDVSVSCAPTPPPTFDFREMEACPNTTEFTA